MAVSIRPNSAEYSEEGREKINNSLFLLPSCQQDVFNIIKELKN